jgi:glycosyltransferase involved in cell wall biosynthesis
VPVRAPRFPDALVATLLSAAVDDTFDAKKPKGGGAYLNPLPGDRGGRIVLREVLIVVPAVYFDAVQAAAPPSLSSAAIPVLVKQFGADQDHAASLSSMVNAADAVAARESNALLTLLPHLDIAVGAPAAHFIASMVAAARSDPAESKLGRLRAANRGPVAVVSCAPVEVTEEPEERRVRVPGGPPNRGRASSPVADPMAREHETVSPTEQESVAASVRRAELARVAKNPHTIVHKGFLLSTTAPPDGMEALTPEAVHAVRYLHGYSARDARLHESASVDVDVVPLDCALINRTILREFDGLPPGGMTSVDYALVNRTDFSFNRALLRYRDHTDAMKLFFSQISIEDAASLDDGRRKLLSGSLDSILRREDVVNQLIAKLPHKGAKLQGISPDERRVAESLRNDYLQSGLSKDLLLQAKSLIDGPWDDLTEAQNLPGEQEVGFELSLRAQFEGMRVVASNATALTNTTEELGWLPPLVPVYGVGRYFDYPSYALSRRLVTKWTRMVHAMRTKLALPAPRRRDPKAYAKSVRVLWDFVCCECCGFSNEVQDLLAAAQPFIDVHSVAQPSCFCPGPVPAVGDAIARSHLPTARTAALPLTDQLIFVIHRQPSLYEYALETYFTDEGAHGRKPSYVVGRSMYEFDRVHDRWVNATRLWADELWVPAKWVRDVFVGSGVNASKVFVVPEAIDVHMWDPALHRRITWPPATVHKSRMVCNRPSPPPPRRAPGKGAFVFFSDFKLEPRKGWDVLFEAYRQAFDASDPVTLYVLTNLYLVGVPHELVNPRNRTVLVEVFNAVVAGVFNKPDALHESLSGDDWPHFCLMVEAVPEEDLVEMYNSVDAFVMPTRGEGWGLPLIQAMAMQKPVLATRYGGQSEFMTDENSYAIDYTTGELPPDTPYSSLDAAPGQRWAVPSVEHTASLMRSVFADEPTRTRKGRQARRDVVANFSYDVVGKVIMQQVQRIKANIDAGAQLREPAMQGHPYRSDPRQRAEVALEELEEAAMRSIQLYNEVHGKARKPLRFRRDVPDDHQLVRRCVDSVTLAHLQVVYQQRGSRIPAALIDRLTPAADKLRRARVERIMAAEAAGHLIDPVVLDLLDFPLIRDPESADAVLPRDLKHATTEPTGGPSPQGGAPRQPQPAEATQVAVELEQVADTPAPSSPKDAPTAEGAVGAEGWAQPSTDAPHAVGRATLRGAEGRHPDAMDDENLRRRKARHAVGEGRRPLRRPGLDDREAEIARRNQGGGGGADAPKFHARVKRRRHHKRTQPHGDNDDGVAQAELNQP